jgi:autotransporter-associated beta strand protein
VITNAGYISLGDNGTLGLPGFNAHPEMEMSGGTAYVVNLNIGNSSGSRTELNMRGGTMTVSGAACFAMASNTVATGTLSGDALLQTAPTVDVAIPYGGAFATATLYLNGGTLQTRNIVRNWNGGSGTVYLNGGTLKPNASGQTLQNMSAVYVSTNGAFFDTSLADYTVRQDLLHDPVLGVADGGLTKTGIGTLTLSGYGSAYDGPTVVSGGTLCVAGALPASGSVTVGTDGELLVGGSATQTVSAASLTLDGNAMLSFAFTLDGTSNDQLTLANPPTLAGKRIGLYQLNTRLPFTKNGAYTLLAYSGADPDTTGLAAANLVFGKTYTYC